jgi:hypothetical protein
MNMSEEREVQELDVDELKSELKEELEKEQVRLLKAEEVRLRALWKNDISAAQRGERPALLGQIEHEVERQIGVAVQSVRKELRAQHDAHRTNTDREISNVRKRVELMSENLNLFADTLEARLKDWLAMLVEDAFVKTLDEHKKNPEAFLQRHKAVKAAVAAIPDEPASY